MPDSASLILLGLAKNDRIIIKKSRCAMVGQTLTPIREPVAMASLKRAERPSLTGRKRTGDRECP